MKRLAMLTTRRRLASTRVCLHPLQPDAAHRAISNSRSAVKSGVLPMRRSHVLTESSTAYSLLLSAWDSFPALFAMLLADLSWVREDVLFTRAEPSDTSRYA